MDVRAGRSTASPVDPHQTRMLHDPTLDPSGKGPDCRSLHQDPRRKLRIEQLGYAPEKHERQQRLTAEFEEVVIWPR